MSFAHPFWELPAEPGHTALIEESGSAHSYGALAAAADELAALLPGETSARSLGFILLGTEFGLIASYLACLRSGRAVPLLLQPNLHPSLLERLLSTYRPDWIVTGAEQPVPAGYRQARRLHGAEILLREKANAGEPRIHPDLALLLSTSGSTGSQKLVRLSYSALHANAASIVEYLELGPEERSITTLPLSYSFGLSILNSHLQAGGSIVLTERSLISREFWSLAQQAAITSLSGVPSTFEMLLRVGLEKRGLSRLRTLTQAGGALRPDMIRRFQQLAEANGWRMFVMYGQTEASPRISYVPPAQLAAKIGSIGVPIPGGELTLDPETSELIYRGPNVMMGYAESRADLAEGDRCGGVLRTGDLARVDEEGYFHITGRTKRFIKMSGARINLDAVEAGLAESLGTQVACTGTDDNISVWLPQTATKADAEVRQILRDLFDLYGGMVRIRRLASYPLTPNGKIDYRALAGEGGAEEMK